MKRRNKITNFHGFGPTNPKRIVCVASATPTQMYFQEINKKNFVK